MCGVGVAPSVDVDVAQVVAGPRTDIVAGPSAVTTTGPSVVTATGPSTVIAAGPSLVIAAAPTTIVAIARPPSMPRPPVWITAGPGRLPVVGGVLVGVAEPPARVEKRKIGGRSKDKVSKRQKRRCGRCSDCGESAEVASACSGSGGRTNCRNYDEEERPRQCLVCLAHNATSVQAHLCSGRFRIDKHGCEHHACDVNV